MLEICARGEKKTGELLYIIVYVHAGIIQTACAGVLVFALVCVCFCVAWLNKARSTRAKVFFECTIILRTATESV